MQLPQLLNCKRYSNKEVPENIKFLRLLVDNPQEFQIINWNESCHKDKCHKEKSKELTFVIIVKFKWEKARSRGRTVLGVGVGQLKRKKDNPQKSTKRKSSPFLGDLSRFSMNLFNSEKEKSQRIRVRKVNQFPISSWFVSCNWKFRFEFFGRTLPKEWKGKRQRLWKDKSLIEIRFLSTSMVFGGGMRLTQERFFLITPDHSPRKRFWRRGQDHEGSRLFPPQKKKKSPGNNEEKSLFRV